MSDTLARIVAEKRGHVARMKRERPRAWFDAGDGGAPGRIAWAEAPNADARHHVGSYEFC